MNRQMSSVSVSPLDSGPMESTFSHQASSSQDGSRLTRRESSHQINRDAAPGSSLFRQRSEAAILSVPASVLGRRPSNICTGAADQHVSVPGPYSDRRTSTVRRRDTMDCQPNFEESIRVFRDKNRLKLKRTELHVDFRVRDAESGTESFQKQLFDRKGSWTTNIAPSLDATKPASYLVKTRILYMLRIRSVFCMWSSICSILLFAIGTVTIFTLPFCWAFADVDKFMYPVCTRKRTITNFLDVVALAVLLLQLRFSYVDPHGKEEVFEEVMVLQWRMRDRLWLIGIASCIPFGVMVGNDDADSLKVLRIIWVFHFGESFQSLSLTPLHHLLRILGFLCFISHLVACCWFKLLMRNDSLTKHLEFTYFLKEENSLYWWAIRDSTFLLLGKDRVGIHDEELIFLSVLGILGTMNVATIYGNCTWLVHVRMQLHMKRYQDLAWISQAVKSLPVPAQLQKRILNFHHYVMIHHDREAYTALFRGLSPTLMLELKLYMYADLLCNSPFFEGVMVQIIKAIVLKLELEIHSAGDYIIQKDDPAMEMFFIIRGICEVITNLGSPPVCIFTVGKYFGEMALYRNVDERTAQRTAWVKAACYCHLAKITRCDFEAMLEQFPDCATMMYQKIGDEVSRLRRIGEEDGTSEDAGDIERERAADGGDETKLCAKLAPTDFALPTSRSAISDVGAPSEGTISVRTFDLAERAVMRSSIASSNSTVGVLSTPLKKLKNMVEHRRSCPQDPRDDVVSLVLAAERLTEKGPDVVMRRSSWEKTDRSRRSARLSVNFNEECQAEEPAGMLDLDIRQELSALRDMMHVLFDHVGLPVRPIRGETRVANDSGSCIKLNDSQAHTAETSSLPGNTSYGSLPLEVDRQPTDSPECSADVSSSQFSVSGGIKSSEKR